MISNISQLISTSLPSASSPSSSSSAASNVVTNAIPSGSVQTSVSSQASSQHAGGPDKALAAAVNDLNVKIQRLNRNLEFSIDKGSGDLLVKVVDAQTHEIIRQIPSEEAMALAHNIDKYLQEHHMGLVQTKA